MSGATNEDRERRRAVADDLRDMGIDPTERLNTDQAAEYLKMRPNTLARARCRNEGPRCTYSGARPFYRVVDLEVWAIAETERRRKQRRYAAAHEAAEAR